MIVQSESDTPEEVQQYLQALINTLHEQAGNEYSNHRFKVSLSSTPQANAFAAPSGYIIVTTGLLTSVTSENGLAMVLAHKIGQHYERHPLRGMGRGLVMALFLFAILGFDVGDHADKFVERTAFIGQLTYSRKQETASNHIAVHLIQRKYGHASGASEFFNYMYMKNSSEHTNKPPIFLSTHSSTQERLTYLEQVEKQHYGEKKIYLEIS